MYTLRNKLRNAHFFQFFAYNLLNLDFFKAIWQIKDDKMELFAFLKDASDKMSVIFHNYILEYQK